MKNNLFALFDELYLDLAYLGALADLAEEEGDHRAAALRLLVDGGAVIAPDRHCEGRDDYIDLFVRGHRGGPFANCSSDSAPVRLRRSVYQPWMVKRMQGVDRGWCVDYFPSPSAALDGLVAALSPEEACRGR